VAYEPIWEAGGQLVGVMKINVPFESILTHFIINKCICCGVNDWKHRSESALCGKCTVSARAGVGDDCITQRGLLPFYDATRQIISSPPSRRCFCLLDDKDDTLA
jgi:hypothetical protein